MPLGAKLRVPLPRRALLERTRLANPFRPGDHLPRLVLLAAPPGFGKTTLLTRWLGELAALGPDAPQVAWVSLDESDADEAQFLTALVEALAGSGTDVAETRALLATGRPALAAQVLASLINELEVAGPVVIALDDVHRAAGPAVHAALGFLVDNLPVQAAVAMTTRADPPLPLARLRAAGELVEVRAADLRFTTAEAEAFFRTVMGLDLDPAQVEALDARTEGWVAGLQLAALSVRSRPSGVDEFISAFSGSHRFVLDYLVEEVLDAQPDHLRAFLLETSILDRLTGPLCDAVTGRSDGQRQLERLEAANLFVTALDEERLGFRYHQLFAEALRARLAAEHPGRVAGLHLAASRAHAALGQLEEALHHALRSGDTGWAADLVELALPGTRQRRGDRSLAGWINELPDAVVAGRPILAITRAWARLTAGDLAAAADWLDLAEAAPGAPARSEVAIVPDDLVRARDAELRAVPASIAIYRAALAQATGDVAGTLRQATTARDAAPDDPFVQGAAAGFLGLAAWAAGDLRTAIDTFSDAVRQLAAAGNATDELGGTVVLADLALADGRPDEARRLYERALDAAARSPLTALTVVGDLHVGLAGVLIEQDELELAAQHLAEARGLGETAGLQENRFRWHVASAALLRAGGSHDAALAELDAAQKLHLPGFFPEVRPLAAVQARVLIAAGRLGEARRWATGSGVAGADPTRYLDEYALLTLARLVIAEHRAGLTTRAALDEAVGLVGRVLEAAAAADRRGSLVEAHLVQALARQAAGQPDAAHQALASALAGGVPSGRLRLFLDEGAAVVDLLRSHVGAPGHAATAGPARLLLDRTRTAGPRTVGVGDEALSERELEVLRLLAGDLTGPEIAAHLYVSINTLRTHTRHIFTKLGVTTRRAAVTRARELDLI